MLAARRWHARLAAQSHFFLPARQETRLFIAPAELALDPQPEAIDLRDVIASSARFDPSWYIAVYPELRAPEIDAAAHYAEYGSTGQYDPGPTFSSSAYIHAIGCGGTNPLGHWEREAKLGVSSLPVRFGGALEFRPQDRTAMVFAHACRAELFGAEQSLLYVLEDMRQGGLIPVVVLPHMENARYLEALRAKAARELGIDRLAIRTINAPGGGGQDGKIGAAQGPLTSAYLRDARGVEHCSLFARLEQLDTDLAPFEAHLGFRLTPLPRVNTSPRTRDWRPFYSQTDAQLIADLCATDIARFGYQFDPH
jgi:hypothetical protein